MQTPITPFEHIRGTTLLLTGWVKNNGAAKDITNDTITFSIAERSDDDPDNRMTTLIGNADVTITKTPGTSGKYTIQAAGSLTDGGVSARLPDKEYWLQVNLVDAASGKEWCIARGPFRLLNAPSI